MQILHSGNQDHNQSIITRSGIDKIARLARRGRDVLVDTAGETNVSGSLLAAAIACVQTDGDRSLVVVPGTDDVRDIASSNSLPAGRDVSSELRIVHLGPADDARKEEREVAIDSDVLVTTPDRLIDHIRRGNVDLSGVATCIINPPQGTLEAQYSADLHYIYTKLDGQPSTVLFGAAPAEAVGVSDLLRRPTTVVCEMTATSNEPSRSNPTQEHIDMAKHELPFDAESTAQQLRDIVKRIHEEEDAAEMNQYKRFIKKHVSIFSRAYFTAYLFKHFAGGTPAASDRTSVFVSAGRNRRVHARDLVTLFTSADGVSRDDIGQIKVLDNYSFVEVENSKAKNAIDSLNGTDFRGRKLTVNFARRK